MCQLSRGEVRVGEVDSLKFGNCPHKAVLSTGLTQASPLPVHIAPDGSKDVVGLQLSLVVVHDLVHAGHLSPAVKFGASVPLPRKQPAGQPHVPHHCLQQLPTYSNHLKKTMISDKSLTQR